MHVTSNPDVIDVAADALAALAGQLQRMGLEVQAMMAYDIHGMLFTD